MLKPGLFGAAIAIAIASLPLHAQDASAGPVQTQLEARKVVRAADGRETFAPADAAKPGDVIEYIATYRNSGRQPVRNLEVTLPVPVHTELIAGSARPAGAKASLDARTFAAPPLKRSVRRNGAEIEETVPYREYRYLRWQAGALAPQQTMTFTARVSVIDDRDAPVPEKK